MWRIIALACFIASAINATALVPRPGQSGLDGRIVGGESIEITDAPWQVSIETLTNFHLCGGCIVNVRWVLSAAQCAQDVITNYKIRAGTSNRGSGGITYSVVEKSIHSKYNAATYDFDFALFKVSADFTLGTTMAVIALPGQSQEVAPGSGAMVTGWGYMEDGIYPQQLQVVYMPVTLWSTCKTAYAGYREVTDQMICAGIKFGILGGCKYDEGGPLVVNNQLVGIYSWTHESGCGATGNYSVYSKVSSVRNWISTTLPSGVGRSSGSSLVLAFCAMLVTSFQFLAR